MIVVQFFRADGLHLSESTGEQQNREEVWKAIINCSEKDKMYLLFRLVNYFTRLGTAKFLTQDVQAIYDKEFLEVLKEMDI